MLSSVSIAGDDGVRMKTAQTRPTRKYFELVPYEERLQMFAEPVSFAALAAFFARTIEEALVNIENSLYTDGFSRAPVQLYRPGRVLGNAHACLVALSDKAEILRSNSADCARVQLKSLDRVLGSPLPVL
jgi:hypothetical protein